MPGIHLNDTERKLKKQWENNSMQKGSLLGVEIHGNHENHGIRGISDLSIKFQYPVTVLCGKNGTGKTTILSLAVLGFHRFPNFYPKKAKMQLDYAKGSYYTFSNFFYKGPGDSDCIGIELSWHYKDCSDIKITKRSEKWMHYERRPSRAVQYLGSSRVLSAIEQKTLRAHFKPNKATQKITPLNQEYLSYLSQIFSKSYLSADDWTHGSYHIRTCQVSNKYSSFNMGAGEDAVIELLSYIQAMPDSSLCVIEEIELGIHPEALSHLAQVIQTIAHKHHIQFIISSHAKSFIDNLPRCARILLQRFNEMCQVIYGPTTRFAMGIMSNKNEPELRIYCEDEFAKQIIMTSLSNDLRRRVDTVAVGSKNEFHKIYEFHKATSPNMKSLFVWDGDVKDEEISKQFSGSIQFNYFFLHPTERPEYFILKQLQEKGIKIISSKLGIENLSETTALFERLLSLQDLHDFSFEVANATNLPEQDIIQIFISCYHEVAPDDCRKIENLVKETMNLSAEHVLTDHNR